MVEFQDVFTLRFGCTHRIEWCPTVQGESPAVGPDQNRKGPRDPAQGDTMESPYGSLVGRWSTIVQFST